MNNFQSFVVKFIKLTLSQLSEKLCLTIYYCVYFDFNLTANKIQIRLLLYTDADADQFSRNK